MSAPRVTPQQLAQHFRSIGILAMSNFDAQRAIAAVMDQVRVVKTGKSKAASSGVNFRFGNYCTPFLEMGFINSQRECERRLRQRAAREAKHGT